MRTKGRDLSLDLFRGATIVGMVLVNYWSPISVVPAWLKHAPGIGITVADFIAPFFLFAIGMTFAASYRRHLESDGRRETVFRFIRRYSALIGFGAILSSGEALVGLQSAPIPWGVLQAIGSSGLLALFVIERGPWVRAATGFALLFAYQIMLDRYWLQTVLASSHAGILGVLGWAGLLLLSTCLADLRDAKGTAAFAAVSALALAGGIALALVVPIAKTRVSSSYVLITLGAAGLALAVLDLLVKAGFQGRILLPWGRNSLLLYLVHMVCLSIFALPPWPAWYSLAPAWLVVLQAAALVGGLHLLAAFCDRKGFHWVL